jgi:hypothetical protein
MDEAKRLALIAEAVRYCQRVKGMSMPPNCYTKALREPIFYLWDRRFGGDKDRFAQFRSRNSVGLSRGIGELLFDHAVPFSYLQRELLELSEVTPASVEAVLRRHGTFVLITKDEDALLTSQRLKSQMPNDWDGVDKLARYKAAGIEIIDNPTRYA